MKKKSILFLALLLPIGVFLFLKFFGENKFEVTPLFQDDEVSTPEDCDHTYPVPYVIPDSIFTTYKIPENTAYALFVFYDKEIRKETKKQLKRVTKEIGKRKVYIVHIPKKDSRDEVLKRCIFLAAEEQNVVLVDGERRILGQYEGDSLEDMDRLIAELQILLKQY